MKSPVTAAATLLLLSALLCGYRVSAQVILPPQAGNALMVSGNVTVTVSGGLYTYNYSFANSPSSLQNVWFVVVELSADAATHISNLQSPQGWQALTNGPTPAVAWAATQVDTAPANFVDDGSIWPSPFQIMAGQTLSGFSFQSTAPPTAVRFFAQGFTQLPRAVDAQDVDAAGLSVPDYTGDATIGVTQGPTPTTSSAQPSAQGLFTFNGIVNSAVLHGTTVPVEVQFNALATQADRSTFHASLNGQDVTALFVADAQGGIGAVLGSPAALLKTGANTLRGTLSSSVGAVPIYDSGLIVFYLNSSRPADLNGDGVVNCADLAVVKTSFGKRIGAAGFDPRADVNGDGVVNILDLSAEARFLPVGTVCP